MLISPVSFLTSIRALLGLQTVVQDEAGQTSYIVGGHDWRVKSCILFIRFELICSLMTGVFGQLSGNGVMISCVILS